MHATLQNAKPTAISSVWIICWQSLARLEPTGAESCTQRLQPKGSACVWWSSATCASKEESLTVNQKKKTEKKEPHDVEVRKQQKCSSMASSNCRPNTRLTSSHTITSTAAFIG
jgi:hypothetical protein